MFSRAGRRHRVWSLGPTSAGLLKLRFSEALFPALYTCRYRPDRQADRQRDTHERARLILLAYELGVLSSDLFCSLHWFKPLRPHYMLAPKAQALRKHNERLRMLDSWNEGFVGCFASLGAQAITVARRLQEGGLRL